MYKRQVQQDAGGYFGTNRWNSTSSSGLACTVFGNNYRMPCDFNWPYQSINYSLGGGGATNNTRLAWGANFGWLGQQNYFTHGSAFWGGPLANTTANGWPRKSYSTFIVLDRHSLDPVAAQLAEIETVQSTTASTLIGSVRTTGPAGVNRPDNTTYAPAGWNHVRAAWAFDQQQSFQRAFMSRDTTVILDVLKTIGGSTQKDVINRAIANLFTPNPANAQDAFGAIVALLACKLTKKPAVASNPVDDQALACLLYTSPSPRD